MAYLFGFSGRFNRAEWWVVLFTALAGLAFTAMLAARLGGVSLAALDEAGARLALLDAQILAAFGVAALACVWAMIAASVKRCHDFGTSGAALLGALIPVAGQIWLLATCGLRKGDARRNRFDIEGQPSSGTATGVPEGPTGPSHQRLERAVAMSAARHAHAAVNGRRSYQY
jgi:uncharacterized membrane protein YhaH (DUF805 family)